MALPLRHPRALFIAALCHAGAFAAPMRPPAIGAPAGLSRANRDRTLRQIAASAGAAIIAAGRARLAFKERGGMYSPPAAPTPRPRIDPRLAAVIECAGVVAAIGAIGTDSTGDAWVEVVASDPPRLHLFWRGTRIAGDTISRAFSIDKATGKERVVRVDHGTSHRERCDDRFRAALVAAQAELNARGFRTMSIPAEQHYTKVTDFEGLIGTIRLARARPLWLQQRSGRGGLGL